MFKTRQEAEKYLEKYIPSTVKLHFPARLGLTRAEKLLSLLKNPQEQYQTIHIAGTSGKGTTAFLTSQLLTHSNKRVGLHLSPHLEDIRERMIINGQLISDQKFLAYLEPVLKAAEECEQQLSKPSYFEVLTALAMFVFAKEKVDIAVIETGMGGTYDATNTVKREDKIAVITRIGHDHTNILGNTLEKISSHKAGIIQHGNTVFALKSPYTDKVFQRRADEKNANLTLLDKKNIKNIRTSTTGTTLDFNFHNHSFKDIEVSLLGAHQAENLSLALASTLTASKITEEELRTTLKNIHFKGRIDLLKIEDKTIIIDGAHNKQKIKALTQTLKSSFPNQKFTVVLAIKQGKSLNDMLKLLLPLTETLITTTFFKNTHDLIHIAHDANTLTKKARALNFPRIITTNTTEEALTKALKQKNKYILTTGSLYYLQDVYNFYRRKQSQA